MLNRHGYLRGYGEGSDCCAVRANRVYCSNKGKKKGCGKTFSQFHDGIIPGQRLKADTVWKFLSFILKGLSRAAAVLQTPSLADYPGRARRLWKQLILKLPELRANLHRVQKPPDYNGASHVIQTIAHLASVYPHSKCPVSEYIKSFGVGFP
jgi:hypothetical protein